MRHRSFDLAQAGGVISAILRTGDGGFNREPETRDAGLAQLVIANGRRLCTFREPGAALWVAHGLGIVVRWVSITWGFASTVSLALPTTHTHSRPALDDILGRLPSLNHEDAEKLPASSCAADLVRNGRLDGGGTG